MLVRWWTSKTYACVGSSSIAVLIGRAAAMIRWCRSWRACTRGRVSGGTGGDRRMLKSQDGDATGRELLQENPRSEIDQQHRPGRGFRAPHTERRRSLFTRSGIDAVRPNAALRCDRRNAKPRPTKPSSIMAQVAGSGTALISPNNPWSSILPFGPGIPALKKS